METNIDDMNPEYYQYIFEKLFDKGALDVYMTPIIMKKERPAVKLSVLCYKSDEYILKEIIFKETSTFGIRIFNIERDKIKRQFEEVETQYGTIRVKKGFFNDVVIKAVPEYEDVKKASQGNNVPINTVYNEVIKKLLL